ncbi:hypothetical protein ED146_04420 [Escherichia coli]|uniref:Uncharacterized protein n=1 Tax=Shigella sonnei TaxID=624 RepID=A0AAE5JYH2_SHISO|nr:hypothetical protein BSZ13_12080 [Escherichia coli]OYG92269.1 hypothetical protein CI727_15280 [Shigella sonnei]EAC1432504.1 hypothetical protein [Escherichia coli]EEV5554079.1 hypothetical protein [Escherichia coli]EEV6196421.1 hypothetical protein [Escherichia coli]
MRYHLKVMSSCMQDIYNRKNYAMMPIVSVCIKILFTLKKTLRCNLMLVNIPAPKDFIQSVFI